MRIKTNWIRRHKRTMLIVGGVVLMGIISWVTIANLNRPISPSQTKAQEMMQALQNRDLAKAMSLTNDPNSPKNRTVYSLLIQELGSDYQLVKSEEQVRNGRPQGSYIFHAKDGKSRKFVRVLLEEQKQRWLVVNLFASPSEPSLFSA